MPRTLAVRSPGAALVLAGSLLVFVTLYVALAFVVGRQLPSRAVVAGVHLGGMTPTAAVERLEAKLGPTLDAPITLKLASTVTTARPKELGLSVDLHRTVSQATGFSLDPRRVWWQLAGGGEVPLSVDLDTGVAAQALADDVTAVDRPVREAAVTFVDGAVQVVRPQEGQRVDLAGTLARLRSQWPPTQEGVRATTVTAVVQTVPSAVSDAELDRVVTAVARPAVAEPVRAVLGRSPTTLAARDVGQALRMVVEGRTLALRVDAPALAEVLQARIPQIDTEPVDATLRLRDGRPEVVDAVPGRRLDDRSTAAAALVAVQASGAARTMPVHTREAPAALTTQEARSWRVDTAVGSAEVAAAVAGLPDADVARSNAASGAAALDGRVVPAGSALSLGQALGDPAGRYADAAEPEAGGLVSRPGGGLSQLASALYAAGWQAGLDLGPRRPHAVYLPDYPLGLDAVYAWPDADVTLTNPGPAPLLVAATVSGDRLVVTLWGRRDTVVDSRVGPRRSVTEATAREDLGADCVEQPLAAPGFEVEVSREVTRGRDRRPPQQETVRYEPLHPVTCPAPPMPVAPTPP